MIAGDHGESFEHQAWFSHGTRLYDPQVHVPLMVRGPGVPSGARVGTQVRLTDVCPPLLSLAGQIIPARIPEAQVGRDVGALRRVDR